MPQMAMQPCVLPWIGRGVGFTVGFRVWALFARASVKEANELLGCLECHTYPVVSDLLSPINFPGTLTLLVSLLTSTLESSKVKGSGSRELCCRIFT